MIKYPKTQGGAIREFIYEFFLDFKCKLRVVLCCGSRQLCPGKKGNNGIQIEYFPDNFWVKFGA